MSDHGGNRTYDLWNASSMLSQLSYAVRSLRACDISKLSLVPLILYQFYLISVVMTYMCPGVMYFGENFDDICGVALRRKIL